MPTIDSTIKLCMHGLGVGYGNYAEDQAGKTLTAVGSVNTTADSSGLLIPHGYMYSPGASSFFEAADSDDWAFGSGDFAVALRATILPSPTYDINWFVTHYDGSAYGWRFGYYLGTLRFAYSTSGTAWTDEWSVAFTPSRGSWTNFLLCRVSGTLYLFVNGALLSSLPSFTVALANPACALRIGADGVNSSDPLYFTEVLVAKGSGSVLYKTSNYTNPTAQTFLAQSAAVAAVGSKLRLEMATPGAKFPRGLQIGKSANDVTYTWSNATIGQEYNITYPGYFRVRHLDPLDSVNIRYYNHKTEAEATTVVGDTMVIGGMAV